MICGTSGDVPFKKKSYKILRPNGSWERVRGYVHPNGFLAIRPDVLVWTIDHIPTGRSVRSFFMSWEDAERYVCRRAHLDWTFTDPDGPEKQKLTAEMDRLDEEDREERRRRSEKMIAAIKANLARRHEEERDDRTP